VAISLVVIALAFVVIALGTAALAKVAATEISKLGNEVGQLRQELSPMIHGVNDLARTGVELADKVKGEVVAVMDTSRRLRGEVDRGVQQVRRRLADLDALYEVVSEEVEETALDVAATLRNVRRGNGFIGRIRRLISRGRR
jgi:uncharacterized protein YoxC